MRAEVAHGAGRRANIEGIARAHQYDDETVQGRRQGLNFTIAGGRPEKSVERVLLPATSAHPAEAGKSARSTHNLRDSPQTVGQLAGAATALASSRRSLFSLLCLFAECERQVLLAKADPDFLEEGVGRGATGKNPDIIVGDFLLGTLDIEDDGFPGLNSTGFELNNTFSLLAV